MPLSEDEERILNQIERTFYEQDPASAQRIQTTTLGRYLARNCRWAIAGFVAGLVVLVVSFSVSWFLGLVGFAVMTGSAIVLAQNLRRMGRLRWQAVAGRVRSAGTDDAVGDAARRFRRRFRDGDPGDPS